MFTQLLGIGLLDLEELARRAIIERHQDDLIRQIAVDTGTPAQMLRAYNRRTFSTPTESSADSRTQAVDELLADQVRDLEEEQRRLHDERLRVRWVN